MSSRQFSRVHFTVSATICSTERCFEGTVENLSMHGMFLVTDERLPVDEAAAITITLSGVAPEIALTINGKVCRVAENGLGFVFEKIDLESFTHLKNIIAYNIDDPEKVMEEICHPGEKDG